MRYGNGSTEVKTEGPSGKTLRQELFTGPSDDSVTVDPLGKNKQVKVATGVGADNVRVDHTDHGSEVDVFGMDGADTLTVGSNIGGKVNLWVGPGDKVILQGAWKQIGAEEVNAGGPTYNTRDYSNGEGGLVTLMEPVSKAGDKPQISPMIQTNP